MEMLGVSELPAALEAIESTIKWAKERYVASSPPRKSAEKIVLVLNLVARNLLRLRSEELLRQRSIAVQLAGCIQSQAQGKSPTSPVQSSDEPDSSSAASQSLQRSLQQVLKEQTCTLGAVRASPDLLGDPWKLTPDMNHAWAPSQKAFRASIAAMDDIRDRL